MSFGSAKIRKNLAKGKEKVNHHMADFHVSTGHPSNGNKSLDEALGILKVKVAII